MPRPPERATSGDAAMVGFTAAEISTIWGVPRGTVYRYAHERRWRRYVERGRTYYLAEDVIRALDGP
jgi:DNA-directed RNA polymerase specialized sigma24 family protein